MGSGAEVIAGLVPAIRDRVPDLPDPPDLDSEAARFLLFDGIATFLKSLARSRPLVLILDDLHWADGASLLLLEFVAREMASSNLLLIGTYRDVDITRRHPLSRSLGTLVRRQLFQSIELRGLSEDEVGQLTEASWSNPRESDIIQVIHRRTEGNPLFVGEIVRLLERDDPKGGPEWDVRVPTGIRDVIGRRLDGLSQESNRLLATASVIGREFDL